MADSERLLTRKTTVSSFYRAWVNMKTRCNNPNYRDFHRYGGRGISVCEKWDSFDGFIDDMFDSYDEKLTLDRIDNDGDYEKGNCRWATRKEQANNMVSVPRHKYNGKEMTLAEWADYRKIKPSTLRERFYGLKWPIKKCLNY